MIDLVISIEFEDQFSSMSDEQRYEIGGDRRQWLSRERSSAEKPISRDLNDLSWMTKTSRESNR